MNNVYHFPPTQDLIREKLSHFTLHQPEECWQNFESYWKAQKPKGSAAKLHFRFAGLPIAALLKGFLALVLLLVSLGLYNTANARLPRALDPVNGPSGSALHREASPKKRLPPKQETTSAVQQKTSTLPKSTETQVTRLNSRI